VATSQTFSFPASLPALPEVVVADGRTLRILINCRQLCLQHSTTLTGARLSQTRFAQMYASLRVDFYRVVRGNVSGARPFGQADVTVLRRMLESSTADEALVRCAALLRALSTLVEEELGGLGRFAHATVRASPALGEEEFLVTTRQPSVIVERLGPARLPRLVEEESETITSYHPGLRITPPRIGDRQLERHELPRRTAELLQQRARSGAVKLAMTPLTLDADLRGSALPGFPPNEPPRFVLHAVGDEAPQIELLNRLLQRCYDEAVSILVLPELRVPPTLLSVVVDFLKRQPPEGLESGQGLLLVAAGSWHVLDAGSWVNRCEVLDHRGDRIWAHEKLAEYRITPENVQTAPGLKERLGITDQGGVEGIRRGTRLEFCDSPLGRIAVAICVGFFHQPLEQLLIDSGADLLLVPAMTTDVRPIEDRARALVRSQRASTFVANCGTTACSGKPGHDAKGCCFYQIPRGRETNRMPCPCATGDYLHVFRLTDI